jgi:G3E family GTPase
MLTMGSIVGPSHIPITVFTGFLGAGKTSIILSLLPLLPKDYKVVLLKNEFGDVQGMHDLTVLLRKRRHNIFSGQSVGKAVQLDCRQ